MFEVTMTSRLTNLNPTGLFQFADYFSHFHDSQRS
jgi:hypothetical protein